MGMTSEQQKYVFDEFYKIDYSRHDLDSSGLGLCLSASVLLKRMVAVFGLKAPDLGRALRFILL